jgi:hypothetical protein
MGCAFMTHPTSAFMTQNISQIKKTYASDYSTGKTEYLKLDQYEIEWSLHTPETGYLYFAIPNTNELGWAFSPSKVTNLSGVPTKDLNKAKFYTSGNNEINQVFGEGSNERAILVKKGQVILARRNENPSQIYVFRIDQQFNGRIEVSYFLASKVD